MVRADPRVQEAYLGQRGMTALLEIKDLHVAYGKVEAVRGVGLDHAAGPDRDRHRAERRRQDYAACGGGRVCCARAAR